MAGYFSHSPSRFSSTSLSSSSTTAESPTPHRSRLATATSKLPVAAALRDASTGPTAGGHPLKHTWVLWFRQQRSPGNKPINYEDGIKKIAPFSSVESFWSLWTHMQPPSALVPTTDYLIFHSGIRRPVWEDPLNLSGGKWIIRLKKGVSDRLWEDLVLAIIGDQFGDCDNPVDDWPEICGATISVRASEDIISVWNRIDSPDDPQLREKIRDEIRRVLKLPSGTIMEYKSNNDSMQDKSSFRNSAIDRTPLA